MAYATRNSVKRKANLPALELTPDGLQRVLLTCVDMKTKDSEWLTLAWLREYDHLPVDEKEKLKDCLKTADCWSDAIKQEAVRRGIRTGRSPLHALFRAVWRFNKKTSTRLFRLFEYAGLLWALKPDALVHQVIKAATVESHFPCETFSVLLESPATIEALNLEQKGPNVNNLLFALIHNPWRCCLEKLTGFLDPALPYASCVIDREWEMFRSGNVQDRVCRVPFCGVRGAHRPEDFNPLYRACRIDDEGGAWFALRLPPNRLREVANLRLAPFDLDSRSRGALKVKTLDALLDRLPDFSLPDASRFEVHILDLQLLAKIKEKRTMFPGDYMERALTLTEACLTRVDGFAAPLRHLVREYALIHWKKKIRLCPEKEARHADKAREKDGANDSIAPPSKRPKMSHLSQERSHP